MSFGFDNSKLKGKGPFSHVNVDTTYLNIVLPPYKRNFVKCIQCQDTGQVARLGGTPLPCECSSVRLK